MWIELSYTLVFLAVMVAGAIFAVGVLVGLSASGRQR